MIVGNEIWTRSGDWWIVQPNFTPRKVDHKSFADQAADAAGSQKAPTVADLSAEVKSAMRERLHNGRGGLSLQEWDDFLADLEEAGVIIKAEGKTRAISLPGVSVGPVAEETDPHANQVPIVGNVAAGSPILAQECIEDYLTFDTQGLTGEHFALKVRGESMLGAGILPDDLVVVRRQQSVSSGEIVVALLGDEATVKRLSHRNGGVWLLPENDAFQPIDGRNALVLGKVTAVVRQYS